MTITSTTHYPESLAELVPPVSRLTTYITRDIGGVADLDLLEYAWRNQENVLVEGEAGSGKTHLIEAHCAKNNLAFVNVPCNGAVDPDTLFGQPYRENDGGLGWRYGSIVLAAIHGNSVIYLDEVNFLRPNIAAVLHGGADHRRSLTLLQHGENTEGSLQIPLHDTCQIIGTRNLDYRGTVPLNEAFRDRFTITLPFGYDESVEECLLGSPSLREVARLLRESVKTNDLSTPISTRRLLAFEKFVVGLGYPFAVANFVCGSDPEEHSTIQGVFDAFEARLLPDFGLEWVDVDEDSLSGIEECHDSL